VFPAGSLKGNDNQLNGIKNKNHPWDLDLSIIIPLKDESRSVTPLKNEIDTVMQQLPYSWECLWVDDGSTDNTSSQIKQFNQEHTDHQYVVLSNNYGQSAALYAGFAMARGNILVTLDGDGQNDPADIPNLVEHLYQKNCDMVNGVRRNRRDAFLRRTSSRIANGFRNWLTHDNITDVGCSLRVFRHECVQHITPFKGYHRFLPTLIRIAGYTKIVQMPVNHRPREFGQTSYGIHNRLWVGLADTFAVRWMQNRAISVEIKSTSASKGKLENHD
jgi:glycosyltransferase involved in cell wall biosynthesis